MTKHLRVLQGTGVVRCVRVGRESEYELEPKPIDDVQEYLERVSKPWDDALVRLKSLVESSRDVFTDEINLLDGQDWKLYTWAVTRCASQGAAIPSSSTYSRNDEQTCSTISFRVTSPSAATGPAIGVPDK